MKPKKNNMQEEKIRPVASEGLFSPASHVIQLLTSSI